jgi:exopolyphosphatase/guanosine-5'-triphosphate,3'-diphosphate pyrophosphatase
MRIAAIDIGTNSLHMIVVRVRPDLSFETIDREKEMVRLGAGGLGGRALTKEAMHAALQVLSKFRRLAEAHRVERVTAVATSAVREAENGGEFLQAVTNQTGIRARVIAGTEEARLIHLAVAYAVGTPSESFVVVDIGGGSVEITRGVGFNVEHGRSFKLGVIRLTERFVKSDPLTLRDERKLLACVEQEAGEYLATIAREGFDRVVGTSGTILSLGGLAAGYAERPSGGALRNRRISVKQLRRVKKELIRRSLDKRLRLPGLEPRRADLAVAGVVLLDAILARLGAEEITLSDMSLREGLVLDYMARHRKEIAQADRYPDIRRRSVIGLAERCHYWPEHANQVTRLALALFDQTRAVHQLGGREREWLEYAALLHDIGVHISYEGHHKHSCYLIRNGDLRGFEPDEVDIIALVARYHRRATPKLRHEEYARLPRKLRSTVQTLAAILRLAESLDRSHAQSLADVELHDRGDDVLLQVRASRDAELELWAAARHAGPLEALLGKPLRIEIGGHTYDEQPHDATRIPGKTVRGGGDRRLGKKHPARAARQVAERRRTSGVRHGMELVRARQGGHQDGKEEELAHPDDVQSASRDGLRRSAVVQDHSAAQGRNDRAGGSVRLHGVRA